MFVHPVFKYWHSSGFNSMVSFYLVSTLSLYDILQALGLMFYLSFFLTCLLMTSRESLSLTSLVSFGLLFLLFSSQFCNFLLCPNLTDTKIKTVLKVEGLEWWNPIIPISFNSFWHLPIVLYVNPWKVVAELWKTLGVLACGGEEFNPGPETRLDHSELLCNKALLKV